MSPKISAPPRSEAADERFLRLFVTLLPSLETGVDGARRGIFGVRGGREFSDGGVGESGLRFCDPRNRNARARTGTRSAGRINKWFSLIDKVSTERTLQLAWEKVKSNAGACGVDHITVDCFDGSNAPIVVV